MHLATLFGRRFWIGLAMVASGAAVLLWFVPAVLRANQPAPVHTDLVVLGPCAEDVSMGPNYGARQPISYCQR